MPLVALVDDDSIFQFTATRLIESASLAKEILHFENGNEAIQYLEKNASSVDHLPDFLFLDINMPIVDGWMFLEDFQNLKTKLAKEFPIYMVSSSIDPRDMSRARAFSEVKDFVIKPVTIERLTELLNAQ
ncbi:MAG: response regulator [Cyclobacteriaceae bacterium]|jgi:two-component system chemotaxis response regulator CheY|nr:response regulator [Flammeovirgaceae bacterium]